MRASRGDDCQTKANLPSDILITCRCKNMTSIYFHCGDGRGIERDWPSVPRVGDAVTNEFGIFVVDEVHWDDDLTGFPYVHVHLKLRDGA